MEDSKKLVAYTDGSFNIHTGTYGSGIVLIDGNKVEKCRMSDDDPACAKSRQIPGELNAAIYAVVYAMQNGYSSIEIHHDLEGVRKWATGEYRAKNPITQNYAKFMRENMKSIKIRFVWVKGHVGDCYNEIADKLAKEACGVK